MDTTTKIAGGAIDPKTNEERLSWAKDRVTTLDTQLSAMMQAQPELEDIRRCVWHGQHSSGKKLAEITGKVPFPFEGCSDLRVRLADQVVNEKVMLLVVSALRAEVSVRGLESNDERLGAKLTTLLKWALRNDLGLDWIYTLSRLAQYREGDSPAACLASVNWEREYGRRLTSVSLGQLMQKLMATLSASGLEDEQVVEQADVLPQLLLNGGAIEEAAALLGRANPGISEKRRIAAVKDLAKGLQAGEENPECQVPETYLRRNGPRVEALRVLRDVFVPPGMRDFQRTAYYVISEWVAEYELRERQTSRNYAPSFVTQVLSSGDGESDTGMGQHEGAGTLRPYVMGDEGEYTQLGVDKLKGLYQVLTIVYREVDADGIPGVFAMPFHKDVEEPAHKAEMLQLPHDGLPGVWLQREVQSDFALDSRGWPELLAAQQNQIKVLGDGVSNHAQLTTVPPLLTKGRRSTARLKVGPLAEIPLTTTGSIESLKLGDYPSSAANQQAELYRQAGDYAGRHVDGVDPRVSQIHDEYNVVMWQGQLREIFMMLISLYQGNLTDEEMGRIIGADGKEVAATREELQGKFDIDVVFDARGMDLDYLKKKAEIFNEVLKPLDMKGQLKWEVIAASMLQSLDPNLADRAIEPIESANRKEAEDEELNFVKIAAGIEPPMQEAGQDYAAREQRLREIVEANPTVLEDLSETSRQILENRIKHLTHMLQQKTNAQTGRVGAERVTA